VKANSRGRLGALQLGPSGAAFELSHPAAENTRVRVGTWQVHTERQSAAVVARGRVRNYDGAIKAAIPRVEEALDKLSIRGIDDVALLKADHEHLAWWTTPAGRTLRIVTTSFQTLPTFRLSVEVRDATGRLIRPSPSQPIPWHPSYRFFRLSQTTTDLFDAYRNAYLALESILADRTPQRRRGPGQKGEQEGQWFRRALIATGVNLSRFVSRKPGREAETIYQRIYVKVRVRLFHSKPGRDPILPRDRRTVAYVGEALDLTQRLYLAVAEAELGVTRFRGGFTNYAARTMSEAVLEPLEFVATSDESRFDPDATVLSTTGAPAALLPNALPGTYEGFSARRMAWASSADLAHLPFIRRVVGVSTGGQPMVESRLEARLHHAGIDRVEVEFRVLMRNGRDLSSGLV
jgi:hypothetical protein